MKRFLFVLFFISTCWAEDVYVPDLNVRDILTDDLSEVECLAVTLYHEARGEDIEGQRYTAQVIINRMKHKRWPDTLCGVVRQKAQFSFAFDGLSDSVSGDRTAFILAYVIAVNFLHLGHSVDDAHALDYLFYVNPSKLSKMPKWSNGLNKKLVDNHLFMRF